MPWGRLPAGLAWSAAGFPVDGVQPVPGDLGPVHAALVEVPLGARPRPQLRPEAVARCGALDHLRGAEQPAVAVALEVSVGDEVGHVPEVVVVHVAEEAGRAG